MSDEIKSAMIHRKYPMLAIPDEIQALIRQHCRYREKETARERGERENLTSHRAENFCTVCTHVEFQIP